MSDSVAFAIFSEPFAARALHVVVSRPVVRIAIGLAANWLQEIRQTRSDPNEQRPKSIFA
jgi:hypothetical protein